MEGKDSNKKVLSFFWRELDDELSADLPEEVTHTKPANLLKMYFKKKKSFILTAKLCLK